MQTLLQSQTLRLEVAPLIGASIAAFEAKIAGQWVAVMRPTQRPLPEKSSNFSSFTLAPYSNRIRDARFYFAGQYIQLKPNTPEGNSQHGDVRGRPWQTKQPDANTLVCSLQTHDFPDFNWPWAFGMVQTYRLRGSLLEQTLQITNQAKSPMPAGFGIHPYFERRLAGSNECTLQFAAKGYYTTNQSFIPTQAMSPVPPHLEFSQPRSIGERQINGVYGGFAGLAKVEWPGSGVSMRLRSDPVFEHLVVFTAPDRTLALEPVSNATDGFNLMAGGIEGHGVVVLEPGQSLAGTISFELEGLG